MECDIEQYFIKQAAEHECLAYKFTAPSTAGVADRIVIGKGRVAFVELKAPGKKPRPLQNAIFDDIRDHGMKVYVVDSHIAVDTFFARYHHIPDFRPELPNWIPFKPRGRVHDPEAAIEQHFIRMAKKHKCFYCKMKALSTSGVPDRVVIRDGKILFVELKATGKKPRALQKEIIGDMTSHGASVYVIDAKDQTDDFFRTFFPVFT